MNFGPKKRIIDAAPESPWRSDAEFHSLNVWFCPSSDRRTWCPLTCRCSLKKLDLKSKYLVATHLANGALVCNGMIYQHLWEGFYLFDTQLGAEEFISEELPGALYVNERQYREIHPLFTHSEGWNADPSYLQSHYWPEPSLERFEAFCKGLTIERP